MFITVLFHRISFEGTVSTQVYEHGFDEQGSIGPGIASMTSQKWRSRWPPWLKSKMASKTS